MGISIYGVILEPLNFYSDVVDPSDEPSVPFIVSPLFKKSLKKSEIISFVNTKDISEDYFQLSYSGFSYFKSLLCKKLYEIDIDSLYDKFTYTKFNKKYECPFYHFFNFSDCEGYIGPSAVKEMAEAFKNKEFKKKFMKKNKAKKDDFDYNDHTKLLYKIIIETAKANGYLRFS